MPTLVGVWTRCSSITERKWRLMISSILGHDSSLFVDVRSCLKSPPQPQILALRQPLSPGHLLWNLVVLWVHHVPFHLHCSHSALPGS